VSREEEEAAAFGATGKNRKIQGKVVGGWFVLLMDCAIYEVF